MELEITNLNHQGEGVGRVKGMVVFVPCTLIGERVEIEITQVHKKYARGRLTALIEPDKHRREPVCSLFGSCGGCDLQQLPYAQQLVWKTGLLQQSLSRIGGIHDQMVRETYGMVWPWRYRNKVTFKVQSRGGRVHLGFYAPHSHRLVGDDVHSAVDLCQLIHQDLNYAAAEVRDILERYQLQAGLPQELMLRRSSDGEMMVALLGRRAKTPVADLGKAIASIKSVVSVVEYIDSWKTLAGEDYLLDQSGELQFRVSAPSFYQVNSQQAAVLYRKVLEYCDLTGREKVADAYCGVGAMALHLAGRASEVRGYEVSAQAARDAKTNAAINGLANARFFVGEVERVLPQQIAGGYSPDVMVMDPPRSGCKPEVLRAVTQSKARRIIYVSCNPITLARDLARLTDSGYWVLEVQPVDMFPQTAHVETVVLMSRVK